jgi:hypothetical protein
MLDLSWILLPFYLSPGMLPGDYAYNKLCCLAGYSDLLCITVAGDDLGGFGCCDV